MPKRTIKENFIKISDIFTLNQPDFKTPSKVVKLLDTSSLNPVDTLEDSQERRQDRAIALAEFLVDRVATSKEQVDDIKREQNQC